MEWIEFLGADGAVYAIGHHAHRPASESVGRRSVATAAELEPLSGAQLIQLWRAAGAPGDLVNEAPDDDELRRWVAAEVSSLAGRLAMWRLREPIRADNSATVGTSMPLSDLLPPPTAPERRTWVGFRLLDLRGEPLANVTYEVTLSDGTQLSGSTNGDGIGRHEDIVAGVCVIEFPELPESLWQQAQYGP